MKEVLEEKIKELEGFLSEINEAIGVGETSLLILKFNVIKELSQSKERLECLKSK